MRVDIGNSVGGGAGLVLGLGVVVGLGLVIYEVHKWASANPNALNPTSSQNLAYQGVNSVGASLTGNTSFSLGSWLYSLVHPGANAAATAPTPYPTAQPLPGLNQTAW